MRRGLIIVLLLVSLAACSPGAPREGEPLPLTRTFDKSPSGFEFKYPTDWDYTIPMQGVLFAGPVDVLTGSPGPLFAVRRSLPVSIPGSLSAALNSYLETGPLSKPDNWRITVEERDITLDGRPGRIVDLEGAEGPDDTRIHSQVIATTSDNTFVYMFILTVPVSQRDRFEPTLLAMLESVRILE
ncbi:MAG: hypothetical protein UZ13_01159 [Chloroflexi bacterium OLB13]|nr:MAG: hypothetical protein UZ13_01159 [Chloroflexi bacterium OLB13]